MQEKIHQSSKYRILKIGFARKEHSAFLKNLIIFLLWWMSWILVTEPNKHTRISREKSTDKQANRTNLFIRTLSGPAGCLGADIYSKQPIQRPRFSRLHESVDVSDSKGKSSLAYSFIMRHCGGLVLWSLTQSPVLGPFRKTEL